MGIISWIILGLIAGFLASKIMKGSGSGPVMNIVLGIFGAIVGGFLYSALLGGPGITGFGLGSIVVATVGAVIVIWLYGAITGRRP
ncbi:MAG: GlsB/YeaQ/YmgE family stress response membrane protein [Beijerinckiaceae bacterium]